MRSIKVASLVICAVAIVPLIAQTQPMRPGRWEVNVQMEMPGLPAKIPPTVTTQCVTEEQLKDPNSAVPTGPGGEQACKVSDYKVDGSKVTWKMTCSGQMPLSGDGELTFVGDTYTGVINGKADQTTMTLRLNGKRLGDCTK